MTNWKNSENRFAKKLRSIFPNIRSARATQSYDGGNDFVNTPGFNFEVKSGKSYKIYKWIRDAIKQTREGGKKDNVNVLIAQEKYKEPLAIIPFKDFKKLLNRTKVKKQND